MTRQLRLKGKGKVGEKETYRSAKQLIADEVSASALTKVEVKRLIDFYASEDFEIKEKGKVIVIAKAMIHEHCLKHKWDKLETEKAVASARDSTEYLYGDATKLAKILKKLGKIKIFNALVSPKVTECKKYLGEETLKSEKFMKVGNTVKRSSVTIKRK